MIVPVQAKLVNVVEPGPAEARQAEILDRLEEIRAGRLPAFVIRAAGNTFEDALRLVYPPLYVAGFDLVQRGMIRRYADNPDNPPHRNAAGNPGAQPAINVIYAEEGAATGRILEVTDDFNQRSRTADIPNHVKDLFWEGQTDDTVALPIAHEGEVHQTDAFIHAMTGPKPHIHGFRSTVRPRVFKVVTAWQAPSVRYSP